MYRILICDEEKETISTLRSCLITEGYLVLPACSGQEVLEQLRSQEIHLVLLVMKHPGSEEIQTLAAIRKCSNVPVILLTAKSDVADVAAGLDLGADDYVTKPFKPMELLARVKSQLRRYMLLGSGARGARITRVGPIALDNSTKTVTVNGDLVSLTPLEFEILALLMNNAGQVFSPKEIYRIVWNETPMGAENAVAVHIRHIREKIEENPAEPRYLRVVWGKGYKINPEV